MRIFSVDIPTAVLVMMVIGGVAGFITAFFLNLFSTAFGGPGSMSRRELVLLYGIGITLPSVAMGLIGWAGAVSWQQALLALAAIGLLYLLLVAVKINSRN